METKPVPIHAFHCGISLLENIDFELSLDMSDCYIDLDKVKLSA